MKMKRITSAVLLPAAIAVTLSGGAAALAASVNGAGHGSAPQASSRDAVQQARHKLADQWVTAQRGQTLVSIATAHHMTWRDLYAAAPNYRHVHGPGGVPAGQRLRIPADPKLSGAEFLAVWRREAALARRAAAGAAEAHSQAQQSQAQQQGQAQQPSQAQQTAAGQPLTAGMSSFEQCVAWRESSDTPTDPDGLFGILPSTWAELGYPGTAGQASVAQQEVAFSRLYAEYGTQPWAPSDGC